MYGTWVTLQKGTLSLTYKYGRATGGLDRAVCEISAKTVLCPRAAVHRTSSQAPRSYHVHSDRDTRSITSRALGLGAGRADARLDDRFDDRQFTGSTCDALRALRAVTAESACAARRRSAPLQYRTARRSARRCAALGRSAPLRGARALRAAARRLGAPRRCAALGRSAPLHPSLLDEHRCAT